MIRILYFGRLSDELGCSEEDLDWQEGDIDLLLSILKARGDMWEVALSNGRLFKVVVNKSIVHGNVMIKDGAEVGLLPPVTGG